MNIGIIGFDTSHVTAFTDLLSNKKNPHYIDGAKVITGFPGGSPDMPKSKDRVPGFTKELTEKYGVTVKENIEKVVEEVDVILLESVDGRVHLKQFEKIVPYKKPVFIDKPFTCRLDEAKKIKELAESYRTPVFSSSALRYDVCFRKLLEDKEKGDIIGIDVWGPAHYIPQFPGLFWYGIHSAEMLFAAMGRGCVSVKCIGNDDTDIGIGEWKDGRFGVLRGLRKGYSDFGGALFREKSIQNITLSSDVPFYVGLVKEIMNFFKTGESPIPIDETIEIIEFLEKANNSKETGKTINFENM